MGGTTIGSARPVQQTLRCDATEVHADLWRRNNGRVAPWRRRTCEADQAAPQDDWLSVKQIPELCIEAGHPLSPMDSAAQRCAQPLRRTFAAGRQSLIRAYSCYVSELSMWGLLKGKPQCRCSPGLAGAIATSGWRPLCGSPRCS